MTKSNVRLTARLRQISLNNVQIAVIAFAALAMGAVGMMPVPAHAASKPALVIKMQDPAPYYIPQKATIKAGETVEWVNKGATVHTVTDKPGIARNPKNQVLPKGAKPFDSGFVPPGGKFVHTFKVPGHYTYFCIPHEMEGMVGYLTVKK